MKYESFLKYHWKHVFASRWLEGDYQHSFLLEWYTASMKLTGLRGKGSRQCVWGSDSVMKHAAALRSIHGEDIWETKGVLFGRPAYCRWHRNKYSVLLISNHFVLLWCCLSVCLWEPRSMQLRLQPQVSYLHPCSYMHAHHLHWPIQSVINFVSVLYSKTLTEYYPASGISTQGISFCVMYSSWPRCKIPQVIFTYLFHLLLLPLCWEMVV